MDELVGNEYWWSEDLLWMVVHVVLVCSCREEKVISGDVCVWLCCVGSLVGLFCVI